MKKIFYTMRAKVLVIVLLLALAIVAGISGTHVLRGHYLGMSISEMQTGVSYEDSAAAGKYLQTEAYPIFSSLLSESYFTANGTSYDNQLTIDIMHLEEGVEYTKKNPSTTYKLEYLQYFYYNEGYATLSFLLNNEDVVVDAEAAYYLDGYLSDVALASDEEEALLAAANEEMGTEATCVASGEYELEVALSEDTTKIYYRTLGTYLNYENALYNNGIVAEEEYLLPESGISLAEYAQANQEDVSLEELYANLVAATEMLHSYVEDVEETNALLYVKNVSTGDVYTNVSEWKTLSLDEVNQAYMADYASAGVSGAYFSGAVDGQQASSNAVLENGQQVQSYFETVLGEDNTCEVFLALDVTYPLLTSSSYRLHMWYSWWNSQNPFGAINALYVFGVALAGIVLLLILATCQAGRKAEDGKLQMVLVDRFPLEIMILGDLVAWVLLIFVLDGIMITTSYNLLYMTTYLGTEALMASSIAYLQSEAIVLALLSSGLAAWELKRYSRRIKLRTIGSSIILGIAHSLQRTAKVMNRRENETSRTLLYYIAFIIIQAAGWLFFGFSVWELYIDVMTVVLLIVLISIDLVVLLKLLQGAAGRSEIRRGMEELANGNLEYQIELGGLSGDNLQMGRELNGVRDGVRHAVDIEMKSERLKTDLITNVSHDIKTPLTSIINYVDILKRENIQDEKIAGYIDVLDRKSQRLKQLTDDLVEASKISSGNISLDMQPLNLTQLLRQAAAEFDEKLEQRNLQLIMNLPEEDLRILADGQRMYRILENLFNNVTKYAMEGSRVYAGGEKKDGMCIFTLKNISENPLNFEAEELLERFVRGDVARTTEGSGLGLEIAKNLASMQGGDLELYMDGDLFKVTVSFQSMESVAELNG